MTLEFVKPGHEEEFTEWLRGLYQFTKSAVEEAVNLPPEVFQRVAKLNADEPYQDDETVDSWAARTIAFGFEEAEVGRDLKDICPICGDPFAVHNNGCPYIVYDLFPDEESV